MIPIIPDQGSAARSRVDQRTLWRETAALLGGELVEGKHAGADKVVVAHGPWKLWMDTYVVHAGHVQVPCTRVRAYFVGWRGLRVSVRGRNVFDRIVEALGLGRRPHVSRALLEKHVVSGKPRSRLPSLFMASSLGDAILAAPKATLVVKRPSGKLRKRYGQDLGVVVCQTTGVVKSASRLAAMLRVTAEALDGLWGIGEARKEEVAHRP